MVVYGQDTPQRPLHKLVAQKFEGPLDLPISVGKKGFSQECKQSRVRFWEGKSENVISQMYRSRCSVLYHTSTSGGATDGQKPFKQHDLHRYT